MSTAGYIQEGKQQKRHRAAFGCLVFVALLLFLLISAAACVLGWYLITERDNNDTWIMVFGGSNAGKQSTDTSDPDFNLDVYPSKNGSHDLKQLYSNPKYYDAEESITMTTTTVYDTTTNEHRESTRTRKPDISTTTILTTTTSLPTTQAQLSEVYPISERELTDIIQILWDASSERYLEAGKDYALHFQGRTTYTDSTDRAPKRLFQRMNKGDSTILRKFIKLLDNYNVEYGEEEVISVRQTKEQDSFLDAILKTRTLKLLETFITANYPGLLDEGFKSFLQRFWFPFSTVHASSPFERLFVGEKNSTQVLGLNNWLQFYLQEKEKRLNYQGYIHKYQIGLLEVRFTWDAVTKPSSVFLVGTSPEFEVAMYTLCHIVHPQDMCSFSLYDHKIRIQTNNTANGLDFRIMPQYQ